MKKGSAKQILTVVLLLGFLVSSGVLVWRHLDDWRGARNYDEARTLAQLEPEAVPEEIPKTPEPDPNLHLLDQLDLAALQAVNDQVVGWLLIPGTDISYPVVQGEDNDYYLNHTWDGTRSSVGAIFLDCRNGSALKDFNTILYGHKMNNDAMFGQLHQYKEQAFWAANPCLYLASAEGTRRYDIFACYETETSATYSINFADPAEKQAYLSQCLDQNWLDTGILPTPEDQILTLSTCTGDGHTARWVVQAVWSAEKH